MRARNIKPGFFRDEQLLKTSPLGRLLFAGLWCLADREGRLLDRPAQIKWDILPADDCDVNALLTELAMRGFIRRYIIDGTRYIEVTRFLAHQNPHHKEKASIIPPPPDTTPAQKHDSTLLIPDSLIPDSLIPSTRLPASMPSKDKPMANTTLSTAKREKTTDRKANIFLSRQDGNTTRSAPCKQVKHEGDWVEGFFGE